MTSIAVLPENLESFTNSGTGNAEFLTEEKSGKFEKTEENGLDDEENDSSTWRRNIFTLYARVFRIMLAKWKETMEHALDSEKLKELDDLILPSNEEWRYQVYYRLVDLQRQIDHAATAEMSEMKEPEPEVEAKEPQEWDWEPRIRDFSLRPKSGNIEASLASLAAINDTSGSMTEACIEPGWRVEDILLAAEVLQGESSAPTYRNEAEMRRVFGLVYDVLRYKQILNQALHDVGFWYQYSEYKDRERIVWLLLYDMQGRKFSRRVDVASVELRERAFCHAGLKEIEDALLDTKTRLAASVSRLRIGGSALTLDELLPDHLRTAEGVTWGEDGAIASGWVNTMKISSKAEFVGEMAKLQLRLCAGCGETELEEDHYVFDPLCPKVVNLHDKAREKLAISDLVTSYQFIFLERSLCQGAAALAQAVRSGRLCGPVVLTHSIAPRHTAYLAGLLADIEDAGRLLAFGTGERRSEYEQYLDKLGLTIQQCQVFSERYVTPPPLAELERATVVLATPPCSYTGIKDVVDLAVARGGDTGLLETLTNIDVELSQPKALLTEQFMTLKYALTRPNVQLLLYEAHSILSSETFEMVEQVTEYANQLAGEKYTKDHPPKRKIQSKESATKVSRSGKSGKRSQSQDHKKELQDERRTDEEDEASAISAEIEVPDSDLFEIGTPTDLYGRESAQLFGEGYYLAVIKRKEMMQFNSLFMIKVAESKGLFGDPTKQPQPQQPKEEHIASPVREGSQMSRKKAFKRAKIQMDRIAAPTHSSLVRSSGSIKQENNKREAACPKHSHRVAKEERSSTAQVREARRRDARRWWDESAQFLLHAAACGACKFRLFHTDPWTRKIIYSPSVQDIVFESEKQSERNPSPIKLSRVSNVPSTASQLKPKLDSRQMLDSSKLITSTLNKNLYKTNFAVVLLDNDVETNLSTVISVQNATNEKFLDDKNVPSSRSKSLLEPYPWISNPNDYRNSSTFNFRHGLWALVHATQQISLENILEKDDKENLRQFQLPHQLRSSSHFRDLVRLYRPRESSNFNNLTNTQKCLTTTHENVNDSPYIFSGTGNWR